MALAPLALCTLALAVFGAGVFPFVTLSVAATLCLVLLLMASLVIYFADALGRLHTGLIKVGAAILIFGIATTVPIAPALDWIGGPLRVEQNRIARDALKMAHELKLIDMPGDAFSLSRNRAGTVRTVVLLVAVFAAAVLSSMLTTRQKLLYLQFLTGLGLCIAVAGVISQHIIPQGKRIWWFFPVTFGQPVGCFLSRNHFGGFLAMLAPIAVILSAAAGARRAWLMMTVNVVAFIALTSGVVLSYSRGAFITYCIGIIVVSVFAISRTHRMRGVIVSIVAGLSLITSTFLIHGYAAERLATIRRVEAGSDGSLQRRLQLWRGGVAVWQRYPIIGAGAEGYRAVFPEHGGVVTRRLITHAENEYVQLLVDGGLVSVLLGVVLIVVYGRNVWRYARWSTDDEHVVMAAVLSSLVVVAVHAAADFAPFIPLYAVVAGSIAGLLATRRDDGDESANDDRHDHTALAIVADEHRRAGQRRHLIVAAAGCLLFIGFVIGLGARDIERRDTSLYLYTATPDQAAAALASAPTYWYAWTALGRHAVYVGGERLLKFGQQCLEMSARYNPNNADTWRDIASVRRRLGDKHGATAAMATVHSLSER